MFCGDGGRWPVHTLLHLSLCYWTDASTESTFYTLQESHVGCQLNSPQTGMQYTGELHYMIGYTCGISLNLYQN